MSFKLMDECSLNLNENAPRIMSAPKHPFLNILQEIIISPNGAIIGGNNAIFNLESYSNLFEVDPFFESLKDLFITSDQAFYVYPCVNFSINDKKCYCDVTIKRENGFLAFVLFNYSARYEKIHKIESKKNKEHLSAHHKKTVLNRPNSRVF